MNAEALRELLGKLQDGTLSVDEVADSLRQLPYERIGDMALVDHHRELRVGAPEIIYGEGKSAEQITEILRALNRDGAGAMASRVSAGKAEIVLEALPEAQYHPQARCLVVAPSKSRAAGVGKVAVLCAGTSDLPVAKEALLCLEFLGQETRLIADVGVSGLHRLLDQVSELAEFQVLVVVAGMEGALPTVVAGLVGRPIIALPTSVGYGVSLGGFAALASMLSSCAPGVSVVNIDNGIGAAMVAARINRRPGED